MQFKPSKIIQQLRDFLNLKYLNYDFKAEEYISKNPEILINEFKKNWEEIASNKVMQAKDFYQPLVDNVISKISTDIQKKQTSIEELVKDTFNELSDNFVKEKFLYIKSGYIEKNTTKEKLLDKSNPIYDKVEEPEKVRALLEAIPDIKTDYKATANHWNKNGDTIEIKLQDCQKAVSDIGYQVFIGMVTVTYSNNVAREPDSNARS